MWQTLQGKLNHNSNMKSKSKQNGLQSTRLKHISFIWYWMTVKIYLNVSRLLKIILKIIFLEKSKNAFFL